LHLASQNRTIGLAVSYRLPRSLINVKEFNMRPAIGKKLALYAALALSPAVLFAQGMTPSTSDQTTKSSNTDSMYQKDLAACDKQPAADQDTCRSKVDQKYAKKSSTNTPPTGTTGTSTPSTGKTY
jgi:hypothetical protein